MITEIRWSEKYAFQWEDNVLERTQYCKLAYKKLISYKLLYDNTIAMLLQLSDLDYLIWMEQASLMKQSMNRNMYFGKHSSTFKIFIISISAKLVSK